ncbi:uncharacterized protein LOC143834349 isoform X2 [Paroedura picta]|uniref:uncharacterized protein LOC143834349 isoform X2 n=2 Tax=Paroedura picta TaxID=143630 RepID=UPI0040566A6D
MMGSGKQRESRLKNKKKTQNTTRGKSAMLFAVPPTKHAAEILPPASASLRSLKSDQSRRNALVTTPVRSRSRCGSLPTPVSLPCPRHASLSAARFFRIALRWSGCKRRGCDRRLDERVASAALRGVRAAPWEARRIFWIQISRALYWNVMQENHADIVSLDHECEIICPGEKPHYYAIYGQSFGGDSGLITRERQHVAEKRYRCPDCGKCFKKRSALLTHERTHTGEKPYTCSECGNSFSNKSSLTRHKRKHTGEKPFGCPICGKRFSQSSSLIRHERNHTGLKPYKCSDCGKSFKQSSSLLVHGRTHTGETPYSCSVCGKSFSQSSNLVKHERIHTGEKPYRCSDCGNTFGNKSSLTRHKRNHTGLKPYKCLHCGKRFKQSSGLLKHETVHVQPNLPKSPEPGRRFHQNPTLVPSRSGDAAEVTVP